MRHIHIIQVSLILSAFGPISVAQGQQVSPAGHTAVTTTPGVVSGSSTDALDKDDRAKDVGAEAGVNVTVHTNVVVTPSTTAGVTVSAMPATLSAAPAADPAAVTMVPVPAQEQQQLVIIEQPTTPAYQPVQPVVQPAVQYVDAGNVGPSGNLHIENTRWQRLVSVGLHLAIAGPVGWLGASVGIAPTEWLELGGGVGVGLSGPQFAGYGRLRLPLSYSAPDFTFTFSGGNYEDDVWDFYCDDYCDSDQQWVNWMNFEVGWEFRTRSAFGIRPYLGYAHPAESSIEYTDREFVYTGVEITFSFGS